MHLVLWALGIGREDEIITPSMTFASTVNLVVLSGARPVFVDVDYDTLLICAEKIEEKITKRTRAVIPVHFAGAPADMDKILEVAHRHRLVVIEDAAHALGTRYKDKPAGGFGQIAIFSFHPIKNITTAEGGMIVHHGGDDLERRLRLLRFHGIERDAWRRYGEGGTPVYDIQTPGLKYNLTDLQAALGLAQLERLGELNRRRSHLASLYMEGLKDVKGIDLPRLPPYPHVHAWHLFVIKVHSMDRETFMEKLSQYRIGCGIHFPAGHRLSYVQERFGVKGETLEKTERASERIVSLPLFPDMADEDVFYVCEAVKEILNHG